MIYTTSQLKFQKTRFLDSKERCVTASNWFRAVSVNMTTAVRTRWCGTLGTDLTYIAQLRTVLRERGKKNEKSISGDHVAADDGGL